MPNFELIGILGLEPDHYIINGSAALAAYGSYDKPIHDVDITTDFEPLYFEKLGLKRIPGVLSKDRFQDKSGSIDVSCDINYFRQLYPNTVIINNYRYMGYADLLRFYDNLYHLTGKTKYSEAYCWLKKQKI